MLSRSFAENAADEDGGSINPADFSWEIFLPAFAVKPPLPNWGVDSWVCCSIAPYTFPLTAEGEPQLFEIKSEVLAEFRYPLIKKAVGNSVNPECRK